MSERGYLGSYLIPTMPEHHLRPLLEQFSQMLAQQPVFSEMFGAV